MRTLAAVLAFGIGLAALPQEAGATNYILYFHGRGEASWTNETANGSNWTNVTFSYNGNARLADSTVDSYVRGKISTYCGTGNSCIIECYSAGCLRMLKAVNDLRAGGNSLPGLFWVEGAASAAGGTKLAETSTSGGTGFVAKLLGQQEAIDKDITRSAARSTYGYVQNNLGVWLYHTAGKLDICKTIAFVVKLCGNSHITSGGVADGAVGMDSAAGYSAQGDYTTGCNSGKYSWRTYDPNSTCTGESRDHFGMAGRGAALIAQTQGLTTTDANRNWSDPSPPSTTCSGTGCDAAFATTAENYSKTPPPALTPVTTSVASRASNTTTVDTSAATTCYGHCGGSSPNGTCFCDSACTGYGDCCSDFAAANCSAVNSGS